MTLPSYSSTGEDEVRYLSRGPQSGCVAKKEGNTEEVVPVLRNSLN